jgi:hypothetical protein
MNKNSTSELRTNPRAIIKYYQGLLDKRIIKPNGGAAQRLKDLKRNFSKKRYYQLKDLIKVIKGGSN